MMGGKDKEVDMDWVEKDLVNQKKEFEIYPEEKEKLQCKEF